MMDKEIEKIIQEIRIRQEQGPRNENNEDTNNIEGRIEIPDTRERRDGPGGN